MNSFLHGAAGAEGGAGVGRMSRMQGIASRRWGRMFGAGGIMERRGALGVVEAMGRQVGNTALQGMMLGAAANTGLQVLGNVTNGQNALQGVPGAVIRGGLAGGALGGVAGFGGHFLGRGVRRGRPAPTSPAAPFRGPAGMAVAGRPTRRRINPNRAVPIQSAVRQPSGRGPAARAGGHQSDPAWFFTPAAAAPPMAAGPSMTARGGPSHPASFF